MANLFRRNRAVGSAFSFRFAELNGRVRSRAVLVRWRQFLFFIVALIILGFYQVLLNLDALEVSDDSPVRVNSRTNRRAIKSLESINSSSEWPAPQVFSQDLGRRGPPTKDISCNALFKGDQKEQAKAKTYMEERTWPRIYDHSYIELTKDCKKFHQTRGYILEPLSQEEADFPIAFSVLMYKNVEQVERLLRAIYMPQNYYCFNIDEKASDEVHLAMQSIVRCFPNVFIASKLESIYWGHISIVNAELTCLRDLMRYKWKYYINLSGQMFPLQTNRNLVKILKLYNGANDIEGTYKRSRHSWMIWRQIVKWKLVKWLGMLVMTPHPKGSPPHDVIIYKGSNQVAASRKFIEYALYSREARDILEWLKDTHAPDEYFLPTLNHNPHLKAPGGYRGDTEKKIFTARASIWQDTADQINWSWNKWECQGQWVRNICILGVGDLPWAFHRPELFVNKIFIYYEPLVLSCMEQLHYNRTMLGDKIPFDPTYYKGLDIVKHRELVNLEDQNETTSGL